MELSEAIKVSDPMCNPWLDLPETGRRVLPADAELLDAFNSQPRRREFQYDLSLFPEPYFGSRTARVVVLNLNPGWSEADAAVHAGQEFAAMARASLRHALEPYPFLHLQPVAATPGGIWWHQRVRRLVEDVGFDAVAQGLGCVQYMPYHSQKYHPQSPALPSQQYSFALVREAIQREAEIVILRSQQLWLAAVPELVDYDHCHNGANPRSPYLSPRNLGDAYPVIVQRLRANR